MKAHFPGVIVLSLLLAGGIMPVARAENLEQTQQLIRTKDCPRCDLNKAGLVYANLIGANLSEASLIQANLSHADLSSANLQGANLNGATLFGADLSGADLSGANLQGVDLRGAILTNANFQDTVTDGANFLGAVGLPADMATVENYYHWGMEEAERENFRGAVNYYNQALSVEPDFAHAYLARSIARFRLGEHLGALEDAQYADQLYLEQNNERGHLVASQFSETILTAQEIYERRQRGGRSGGAGGNILNVLGGLAGIAFQMLKYVPF